MTAKQIVIMAGGRGERFWPQSRIHRPKHLLPIVGETPMLQQTLQRLGDSFASENVWIITNGEQVEAVRECCPEVPPAQIVAEPAGRDTAAAVGLAALLVQRHDPECAFAILPADHVIRDQSGFQSVLHSAFSLAEEQQVIVTIGIPPTHPATGYGYIQQGEEQGQSLKHPVFAARQFREKPDEATAREYIASGGYYWNAGMFVARPAVFLEALKKYAPGLYEGLAKIDDELNTQALDEVLAGIYPQLEKISIDFAVMEKADNVMLIPASFDWDDVGEWPAIARHSQADQDGNVTRGEVLCEKASNNIVINDGKRVTVVVGLENTIVVETADATLVCSRERAQEIKAAVSRMSKNPDWQKYL